MRTVDEQPINRTVFAKFTRKYDESLGPETQHFIEGYANTDTDIQGIRLTTEATRTAMIEYDQWRNVRFMHEANPIGVVRDWRVDERGLWVRVQVVDEPVWQKVDNGVVTGFSIGFGWDWNSELIAKWLDGETIEPDPYWLTEISIVDRPADVECSFSIVRRAEGANTGGANAGEIVTAVKIAFADLIPGIFRRKNANEGGEGMAKDERDLNADVERLTTEKEETERALAEAKEELAKRDAEAEEERKTAAKEFVQELADDGVIVPADAEKWIARRLADAEWAGEHAEALRVAKNVKPKAERTKEGRPADSVPGPEAVAETVAARARELQKENKELSWEAAVTAAEREITEGV